MFKVKIHGLDKAIDDIKSRQKRITEKKQDFLERLAMAGAHEASVRFTTAMYDGLNDVSIEARPTETGWEIIASGQAVCFIEFGAGIYYNSAEPYPVPRPDGIVGIGEYGHGLGRNQGWFYFDESGEKQFTRGNPASMPMYYASEEMRRQIEQIAREVLRGD